MLVAAPPPTTLTVLISHPDALSGGNRNTLHNTIVGMLDSLGSEWQHIVTRIDGGNLLVQFTRPPLQRRVIEEVLPGVAF